MVLPDGTFSLNPFCQGPDPSSRSCTQNLPGVGTLFASASLVSLQAVARVDLTANYAYNSSALVRYWMEISTTSGSNRQVPLRITRNGSTEVGGAGRNTATAAVSINDTQGSLGNACSGNPLFQDCNSNTLPHSFSGQTSINLGPGVYHVDIGVSAGVNGNGGGTASSFAHAWADPYIEIDQAFLDLYPGQYSLSFSGNIALDVPLTRDRPVDLLRQNAPNPFDGSTQIVYSLAAATKVTLKVYDVAGRERATLLRNELQGPGTHQIEFHGHGLESGIYLYRLQTGRTVATKTMVLFKGRP